MGLDELRAALPDHAEDLRRNLGSVIGSSPLPARRVWGAALTCAVAARNGEVIAHIAQSAREHLPEEAMTAAAAAASIMAMTNVYYRAKHLMGDPGYAELPARLSMRVTARPGVDKVDFKFWALAVSAMNGCGVCVETHEKVLRAAGVDRGAIHEALRIAAVVHAAAVTLDAERVLADIPE